MKIKAASRSPAGQVYLRLVWFRGETRPTVLGAAGEVMLELHLSNAEARDLESALALLRSGAEPTPPPPSMKAVEEGGFGG